MLNDNSDILFDIAHSPEVWKATFCTEDGMRKALENRGEGFDIKRRPYATEEIKKAFIERFKRDGFEAPVCCKLLPPPPPPPSEPGIAIWQGKVFPRARR